MKVLEDKISKLDIPSSVTRCRNVKCRDPEHRQDLDILTIELLETVQEVAEDSLPVPTAGDSNNRKDKKVTPGWSELVRPFRDEAYFWNQIWLSWKTYQH